jgi:hypothetical protein
LQLYVGFYSSIIMGKVLKWNWILDHSRKQNGFTRRQNAMAVLNIRFDDLSIEKVVMQWTL